MERTTRNNNRSILMNIQETIFNCDAVRDNMPDEEYRQVLEGLMQVYNSLHPPPPRARIPSPQRATPTPQAPLHYSAYPSSDDEYNDDRVNPSTWLYTFLNNAQVGDSVRVKIRNMGWTNCQISEIIHRDELGLAERFRVMWEGTEVGAVLDMRGARHRSWLERLYVVPEWLRNIEIGSYCLIEVGTQFRRWVLALVVERSDENFIRVLWSNEGGIDAWNSLPPVYNIDSPDTGSLFAPLGTHPLFENDRDGELSMETWNEIKKVVLIKNNLKLLTVPRLKNVLRDLKLRNRDRNNNEIARTLILAGSRPILVDRLYNYFKRFEQDMDVFNQYLNFN